MRTNEVTESVDKLANEIKFFNVDFCLFQAVLTSDIFQRELRNYQQNNNITLDEKKQRLCVFAKKNIVEAHCHLRDVEIAVTFNFDGSKEFKVCVGTGKQKICVYYDENDQIHFSGRLYHRLVESGVISCRHFHLPRILRV